MKIIRLEKEYLIRILNSLKIYLMIVVHIIVIRDGINQNWIGNSNNIRVILNQFRENNIEVDGSKIEKIFIIIVKFN